MHKRVCFPLYVSPSQKKFIEKEAKRQYITQSAVIRGLLDTAMAIAKDLK